MASHAQDDGFHEIQLNGKQLVFVFMATTVVLVVTFLCGVLVGRGVRAERTETARVEEPTAVDQLKNSIDPGKPPTVQQNEDPTQAPPPMPAEGGASGQATPVVANAAAGTVAGLATQTAKRAGRTEEPSSEPPTAQKTPDATATPTPAPAGPKAAARDVTPKPDPTATTVAPRGGAGPTVAPAVAAPRMAAAPKNAAAVPVPDDAGKGWVVQVAAVKTRGEADTIVNRLNAKGYSAFVLSNSANVFRVRVGGYRSKRDADSVAARIRKDERVNPWVTR